MLTLESKFSEYVEALKKAGACAEVVAIHDEMLKKNPDLIVNDVYKTFVENPNLDEGWPTWALQLIGEEMDVTFRTSIITDLIRTPKACLQLLNDCKSLTEEERILLKSKYNGKLTAIKDPMEAARLYIDCAPVLTAAESLELKSVFEGKLPTVEKELATGIVVRATAEVAP
jgi:hypothetical protein